MNEIIQQLAERKSVRVFTDQAITESEKDQILQAAVQAPTAGNQQLYTILEISDPQLKASLADACDHQPLVARAPLVLVFLADTRKWQDLYRLCNCSPRSQGAGDLILAADDALIAAQNAVTAAWSLGIGSCYVGDIMEQKETVTSLLNLDEHVFPAALLVFGYPTDQQKERAKPQRTAMDVIVQKNTYHPLDRDQLLQMVPSGTQPEDAEKWVQKFCARKYSSDFAREMNRSVKEYLKHYE